MTEQPYDRTRRRENRFAQARRLAGQARQDRTTAWYIPLVITMVGSGAAFEAFGHGFGFLYALALPAVFVALTWGTIRLMPSVTYELNLRRVTGPKKFFSIIGSPVRTRGYFLVAAGLPVAIALIKTVGLFVLGGLFIVGLIVGAAVLAAWTLERR